MRQLWAVVILVLVASGAVAESDSVASCSAWQIHGYSLGMSKEAALRVRAARDEGGGVAWTFRAGAHEGTLVFDDDDRLMGVVTDMVAVNKDDQQFVFKALKRLYKRTYGLPWKTSPFREDADLAWWSETCDAYIGLSKEYFEGDYMVTMHLQTISSLRE